MKINTELYGNKIAIDGNLKDLLEKRECKILLTITNDNDTQRHQFILGKKDAENIIDSLNRVLNDPVAAQNGFKVVD